MPSGARVFRLVTEVYTSEHSVTGLPLKKLRSCEYPSAEHAYKENWPATINLPATGQRFKKLGTELRHFRLAQPYY